MHEKDKLSKEDADILIEKLKSRGEEEEKLKTHIKEVTMFWKTIRLYYLVQAC